MTDAICPMKLGALEATMPSFALSASDRVLLSEDINPSRRSSMLPDIISAPLRKKRQLNVNEIQQN
jgi:hypothetical protein